MLTEQQEAWADAHVGTTTTTAVTGIVTEYVQTAAGTVVFVLEGEDGTVATFVATPPYTDDARERDELAAQIAQDEEQRIAAEAEAERIAAEAEAAEEALGQRVRATVTQVLNERGVGNGGGNGSGGR